MKKGKSFKFQSSEKAQVSFEMILVLAVVTLLVSAIFIDFSTQANDTFILSNLKSIAENNLNKISIQNNLNCYLKSMSLNGKQVTLDIEGGSQCLLSAESLANEMELRYCKVPANNDEIINCGEEYSLKII